MLMIPLGLTLYMARMSLESVHQQGLSEFESLALESEKALLHRLDSYKNALLGGAGFFQGSHTVSRNEWRSYVENLDINRNFPGINGIGMVLPVEPEEKQAFLKKIRSDHAPDFTIYPEMEGTGYVVTYIEPEAGNRQSLGLNLAFEERRLHAANKARDTGKPAITERIILVQDEEKIPGFLLLYPLYRSHMPLNTVKERRKALRGWIHAPFNAKYVMKELTRSQGYMLNLNIYDGEVPSPDTLIYSSGGQSIKKAAFTVTKKLEIMQRTWLVVWESTPAYEHTRSTNSPLFILVGGLLFTGGFGFFVIVALVRRRETMEWMGGKHKLLLPSVIFIAVSIGTYSVYKVFQQQESDYIRRLLEDEASKIEALFISQTNDRLMALKRMAQRWEIAGGTDYPVWAYDAKNYIQHLTGLISVQWVDATGQPRWKESRKIYNYLKNQDIFSENTHDNTAPFIVTAPIETAKENKVFAVYIPLHTKKRFDGYIAGIFSIDTFFGGVISKEVANHYNFSLLYKGKEYVTQQSKSPNVAEHIDWTVVKDLPVYDKIWAFKLTPTVAFIEMQQSILPRSVLVAGLLIAALSALASYTILISRLKSEHLQHSHQALKTNEETFRAAMEHASIGMALVQPDGRWIKVNQALCDLTGYGREELLASDIYQLTHPEDIRQEIDYTENMLAGEMSTYSCEKRYIHKDGRVIWILLNASLVRTLEGNPEYFIYQLQDITERKEIERLKSEFISVVSHELRTPLTSIRGSLGLIMGAFSADIPEKVKGLIAIAHNNCERLILLINDILDIEKMESGKMRMELKDESLASLTRQAVEANQAYAQKFNTTIMLASIDEHIHIALDGLRYIQSLSNLLSNAAKFSPAGSVINVYTKLTPTHIRICVQDHGSGIPEEFQTRIFGKFLQADSSVTRHQGGTGLGLHITKQIVEQMGGNIGFDTEIGKGTIFWIEFPLLACEIPAATASATQDKDAVLLYKEDNPVLPSVLHVEDDVDLGDVLATAFSGKADVVRATSLSQATALLKEKQFNLVILDLGMPDGSGLSLLEELEKQGNKHTPVVIFSADLPPKDVEQKVEAIMIKSRISETKIIETVMDIINRDKEVTHAA
jgi:PAS domain S-box-containing protein